MYVSNVSRRNEEKEKRTKKEVESGETQIECVLEILNAVYRFAVYVISCMDIT